MHTISDKVARFRYSSGETSDTRDITYTQSRLHVQAEEQNTAENHAYDDVSIAAPSWIICVMIDD